MQPKANRVKPTSLDNFVIQSRAFLSTLNLEQRFPSRSDPANEPPPVNQTTLNGINYFQNQLPYNKNAQVLEDCIAIRGDHFYLKKGEIVRVRGVIGEYAWVVFRGFKGYFPCGVFNLQYKDRL